MIQIDLTPPKALHALLGASPVAPEKVRAMAAWFRRNRRGNAGWEEHGGTVGREWSMSALAALESADRLVDAALDPGGVHVPTAVGNEDETAMSGVVAYAKHPVDDGPWDASEAEAHGKKWAGIDGDVADATPAQRAKFAELFAGFRGDGSKQSDYVLPHHDIRDGKLVTVKAGVSAALARVDQVEGFSPKQRAQMRSHLEKHREEWADKKAARDRADALMSRAYELRSIKLAADMPAPTERDADGYFSRTWIQVAQIGKYKGHPAGPFEFTSEVFDQMVANHEANPNGIVPQDYEHSSEAPGASVFQHGAPAVGWIMQLENRDVDGLWAYVGWVSAPCIEFIRGHQYKFCSPAVVFDATDPVTGDSVGPVLVSCACTNRPFLQGMRPIAARSAETAAIAASATRGLSYHYIGDAIKDRDDLLECLRMVFGLAQLAPESEVAAAVESLANLVASGGSGEGVDLSDLLGQLRNALRLPALTPAADVIAEVRKGLGSSANPTPAADAANASARRGGEPTTQETAMEKTAEHKALEGEHDKLMSAHKALKAEHDGATAKHAAFKGAICKHMSMAPEAEEGEVIDALEKKLSQLDAAHKAEAQREKMDADADVDMVAARMRIDDDEAKAGLLAFRMSNKDAFRKTWRKILQSAAVAGDAAAKEAAEKEAAAKAAAAKLAASVPDVDADWMRLLSGRIARQGGPAPNVAPVTQLSAIDAFYAEVNKEAEELRVKLMRSDPALAEDSIGLLNTATKIVAARHGGVVPGVTRQ